MSSQRVLVKVGPWIFLVLSAFLFLVPAALAGTTLETVDSAGMVGQYTSLAVDGAGKVHISYYDGINYDLKYATNASGAWSMTTPDTGGDVGQYTSLAVDGTGKVHISYYDVTNANLKYATNASGSWTTTTLDSTGLVGSYTSLAVDSNGKIHIGYYDLTNTNLKYATNVTGSWVTATLDSTGNVGNYTSLTVDGTNKVHISYYDSTLACLKYATNASGTWTAEIVANSGGSAGQYTSLAVDASGKMHISYYDYNNKDLKYTTNRSGSWQATILDSTGDVGRYTSLKVDNLGRVHISYMDYTNLDMKYATNVSGNWLVTTVDAAGYVGPYTSLALDSSGQVHIGYFDSTNGDLKYARIPSYGTPLSQLVWSEAGSIALPGWSEKLTVANNTLYVANYDRGVKLFDVTDPLLPVASGQVATTPSFAEGVAVQGTTAYVAQGIGGVATLDVSIPSTASLLGGLDLVDSFDVVVNGSYAYVADNAGGLKVVDISNPAGPLLASTLPMPYAVAEARAIRLTQAGSFVYIAAGFSGLQIVNISNPTVPFIAGGWQASGKRFLDVAVSGNYAYLADWYGGMQILDISNPAAPIARGYVDTPPESHGITVVDNIVFLANGQSGLFVIDASNADAPIATAMIDTPGYALDAKVVGTTVYVADQTGGVRIIQGTTSSAPPDNDGDLIPDSSDPDDDNDGIPDLFEIAHGLNPFVANDAQTDLDGDGFINLREYQAGSLIEDATSKPAFFEVSSLPSSAVGTATKVFAVGSTAYVCSTRIYVVDAGNPLAPVVLGSSPGLLSSCYDLTVSGNFAYVANAIGGGFRIYDVSNPVSVVQRGVIVTNYQSYGVAVSGNYALLADWDGGLRIIDISNVDAPVIVKTVTLPSAALRVTIAGRYAYVAISYVAGIGGPQLKVFDILDPLNPMEVGSLTLPSSVGTPGELQVSGSYLYLADTATSGGLRVIDISNPAMPVLSAFLAAPNGAYGVGFLDNQTLIAGRDNGLRVADITNPLQPTHIGYWDTPGLAFDVAATDRYAYVADMSGGLRVFDISALMPDDDSDGVSNTRDNCPLLSNPDQANYDGDTLGNACDPDDDNDGILDIIEIANGTDTLNSDISTPTVIFTSTLTGLTNQTGTTLTYSANEPATFGLTRNGTPVAVASGSPLTLIEGLNTIILTATDAAGNISTASVTVTRDSVAPVTTASVLGGNYTTVKSVVLTSSESATIYYTVNGTTPTAASSVYSSPLNIIASTTLKYFAVDTAGNNESVKSQSYTLTLSTTPPAPGSSFSVIDGRNGGAVTLNWSSYDPGTTTVAAYQLYTSDRPFTSINGLTPQQSYTPATSTDTITGLADNVPVYVALVPVNASAQFDSNIIPVAVTPTRQGVSGYVKAWITNVPLNHIKVTSGSTSTYTEPDGFFRLTGLPTGSVTLSVGEEGGDLRYVSTSKIVTVTAGQISSITTIKLDPKVHNLVPATPVNCIATAGDGKVTLTWTPNIDADLAGYYIYRDSVVLNTTPIKDSFYIDQTASNGTTYTYTVKAKSATNIYSPATTGLIVTPEATTKPPVNLTASLNCDSTVTLSWLAPASSDLIGYNVYQQSGSTMSYDNFEYLLGINLTTWTSTPLTAGQTYTFAVRSVGSLGEENNTTIKTTITVPSNWNAPQASIAIPKAGKRIDGNALHVQAEAASVGCGTATTSNVRFQYRLTGSSDWLDIPAALAQHPNPAIGAPYFTKWDVTGLTEGDYDLRSIAANATATDTSAGFITVTIDHHQPQIAENRSADNTPSAQGLVEKNSDNAVISGLASALFPAGSLSSDALFTLATLPPEEQPSGSGNLLSTPVDLTLSSGQTTFPTGSEVEVALSYSDLDNNGLIDGQGTFAQDSEAATFNPTSGLWEPLAGTGLDTIKKQVKGKTSHFSIFGLSRKPGLPIAAKSTEIYTPTASSTGGYKISWKAASGTGNLYELQQASNSSFTQNVTTVYTGTNIFTNLSNQPNGNYYYRVRTARPGHQPSEWKAVANGFNVTLTCASIAQIYAPTSSTTGGYKISWDKSNTAGVTYTLYEGATEIYSGPNTFFNVSGKLNGSYSYIVKATKTGYNDAVKGPVSTTVTLTCASIAQIYAPATSSTGGYKISWEASNTAGVTYKLYEGTTEIYSGPNTFFNVSGKLNGTYNYTVKAIKAGYIDAVKGPVSTTVTLTCATIAQIYAPPINTSGSYRISWEASNTSGVTYKLYENTTEIYSGPNTFFNVSDKLNGSYSYSVKATKATPLYLDSTTKGPVMVTVTR